MNIKTLLDLGIQENTAKIVIEKFKAEIDVLVAKKLDDAKKAYSLEFKKLTLQNTVEKELILAGARNLKATIALVDFSAFDPENIDLQGIKDYVNSLKLDEATSFLFFDDANNIELNLKGLPPFDVPFTPNFNYQDLLKNYSQFNM